MHSFPRTSRALILFSSLLAAAAARALDSNGNQMSDVWEMVFGAQGLAAAADTDRDGFSNLAEARAGTNPFDPQSRPGLSVQALGAAQAQTTWPTVRGKIYELKTTSDLAAGPWITQETYAGSGGLLSRFTPIAGQPRLFFRVSIGDADSDLDGVLDWEELTVGFHPGSTHTDRYDATDSQRIVAGLTNTPANNVITISALHPEMSERWPEPGVVAIRRAGGGLRALTVNFSIGGTAAPGVDYNASALGSIAIPPGVREVWVKFTPIADADDAEPAETILVTLQSGSGYSVGSATAATLTLANETAASLPSVKAAARFITQAAFGPDSIASGQTIPVNVQQVMQLGFAAWIDDQFTRPPGLLQPFTEYAPSIPDFYIDPKQAAWWNRAMGVPKLKPNDTATVLPDPLRQRLAFALSQIFVVSDRPEILAVDPVGMANYYDTLVKNAFGNYRQLLFDVSMHPVMGVYLSHLLNKKPDPVNNIFPDENYAREVMQLFSIGLWMLNPDGSRQLDALHQPIPTYSNAHITAFARVFTGLSPAGNSQYSDYPRNFLQPMKLWDEWHDCDPKTLINSVTLPARTASSPDTGAATLLDINGAVDCLFNHPNVGPFIGRQLIQRFVTSNPSPGYISRVAAAFANNGSGVRGDLKTVIKAVLLDPEARDPAMMSEPTFGKLREPFLRVVNFAHAVNAAAQDGFYQLDTFYMDHFEEPMRSPSVFNFYLPTHSPPGMLNQAGLLAPEFQIINAGSAISAPNYFYNALRNNDLHRWGTAMPSRAVRPNLTQEYALVVPLANINDDQPQVTPYDSDPLLRRLDLQLTGGTLSPQQYQIIRESIERITPGVWQWHKERVWMAIYLIVTSPDFCVQR